MPTPAPHTDAPALTRLSATEMARLVRSRELDPVELIEATLRRIDETDPELHAFVHVMHDSARAEAAALRNRAGIDTLALAGVPVAVKDNVDVAGEPTTHGSRATSRQPASEDALLVRRLRDAGAIVVGRTVMPELAIWPFTEPEAYAAARNPWDRQRTPGGSSGGSAVAVAAHMAALAVASDGGGSIRIPAACCGLVGVKPAPGVVPVPGARGEHWYGLSAFGCLARNVEDAALGVDVMAGSTAYRHPQPPDRPLRIAVSTRHPVFGARLSGDIRAAVDAVASALAGAGHDVHRANPRYPMLPTQFTSRWLAGIAEDAEGLDVTQMESRTQAMVRRGRRAQRKVQPAAQSAFAAYARQWFTRHDLLLTPILAMPPVRIGTWQGKGWLPTMLGVARWMGYANLWNVAGAAAVAIPAGTTRDGLPIGVQLVGPAGSEARLLAVAAQVEQLRPFPALPDAVHT
jgi:amidase